MLGSKRSKHVGFDQVGEGEGCRVLLGEIQDRGGLAEPVCRPVGLSEKPGTQDGGGQPQIATSLGDRISGLIAAVLLRQRFLQPALCLKVRPASLTVLPNASRILP